MRPGQHGRTPASRSFPLSPLRQVSRTHIELRATAGGADISAKGADESTAGDDQERRQDGAATD
jgi:hypothetical protein